jgi:hypothetical protein
MLVLSIEANSLKNFMNKLLSEPIFDEFELRKALIVSFARFEIDDAPSEEEAGVFPLWAKLRSYVFNIVKGEKRPKLMRFVFSYPKNKLTEISPRAKALFINISFENDAVLITTGCQENEFSLDKYTETAWDSYVSGFLSRAGIAAGE